MTFVVDSSVALTWCFEDEATPAGDALLFRLTEEGAHAPGLWPLEILNALRHTPSQAFLHFVEHLIDRGVATQWSG